MQLFQMYLVKAVYMPLAFESKLCIMIEDYDNHVSRIKPIFYLLCAYLKLCSIYDFNLTSIFKLDGETE